MGGTRATLIQDHASIATKGRLIECELSGAVSFHSYPIEHAFGLGIAEAEGSDAIYTFGEETVGTTEYLVLTYERDTMKKDIGYRSEWSVGLGFWSAMAEEVTGTEGAIETAKAKVVRDGRTKFARLWVMKL